MVGWKGATTINMMVKCRRIGQSVAGVHRCSTECSMRRMSGFVSSKGRVTSAGLGGEILVQKMLFLSTVHAMDDGCLDTQRAVT
jgi:hypothetical protein